MNLREAILERHSKEQTNKIVKWIGDDQKRFDELFSIFLNDEFKIMQRAAWPLGFCVLAHPELIQKHLSRLLKNLYKPGHGDSVKRNSIRLLQYIRIPAKLHGDVMNICFQYISDPKEKVVVKVYSMIVLQDLSVQYPDIRQELKTVIEDRWDYETGAFRSRAKKVLKELKAV